MSDTPCRFCGSTHGVRCPAVAAIEYHPDGTVRRVEFVQPQWPPAQLLAQPAGAPPPQLPDFTRRVSAEPQPWMPSWNHGKRAS
jgi:hypothetical protein